ncbi:peptidase [Methylosinus sp. C49]|uniref:PepSY-associated TM helix domain-containing protein n=1 Tax=Methylosinus sp. C49 TaxID=2699395 RepID=UPI0013676F4E|nr:PepSY-associated TM helix domain-containing protein [Methylosinus sp. C49]BBU60465.1 peptidase [Methylosinus sp. C49]
MTRPFFVWLHRWCGLAMAAFLAVAGLTGSLLAFWPELNHVVAPDLYPGPSAGAELDAGTLASRAEAFHPGVQVVTVNLSYVPGTAELGVRPAPGAPPPGFDYLLLDPVTGEERGRLSRGSAPSALHDILPFIYRLHFSLALGKIGSWILGVTAIVWTLDSFVGFYLALPRISRNGFLDFLRRWRPSWLVKRSRSWFRINFDLHRACGSWLFVILLVFSWSSVSMLMSGFYTRAMQIAFDYQPRDWVWNQSRPTPSDGRAMIGWRDAQRLAERHMAEQAKERGFAVERPLAMYLARENALYQYRVRSSLDIGDRQGLTSVLFDAYTGELYSIVLPTGQRAANSFTTWIYELHKANVFGLPYRIFVSLVGVCIALLSITGVYVWWMKSSARSHRSASTSESRRPG